MNCEINKKEQKMFAQKQFIQLFKRSYEFFQIFLSILQLKFDHIVSSNNS